jgi:NADP-dependent 3-hydroxy acid dehydrogenase YdfG
MAAESPLAGRQALITGGGTGIGAAAAAHLSAKGAKLSLLGRRLEPLQAVAETYGGTSIQ